METGFLQILKEKRMSRAVYLMRALHMNFDREIKKTHKSNAGLAFKDKVNFS